MSFPTAAPYSIGLLGRGARIRPLLTRCLAAVLAPRTAPEPGRAALAPVDHVRCGREKLRLGAESHMAKGELWAACGLASAYAAECLGLPAADHWRSLGTLAVAVAMTGSHRATEIADGCLNAAREAGEEEGGREYVGRVNSILAELRTDS